MARSHMTTELLNVYLPMDRRQALAHGTSLAERSLGVALLADLVGFTPLTEAIARALGPLRGAEEVATLLNQAYGALIEAVDSFGGSVVCFSGDAITCWFDNQLQIADCGLQIDHKHNLQSTIDNLQSWAA